MNGILDFVVTELGPQGVGFEVLRDFWVVRSNECPKAFDCILLADLEHDRWPVRKVLDSRQILGQHALVYAVELFSRSSVHVK